MKRIVPVFVSACAILAGCRAFGEPTPEVLARVRRIRPCDGPCVRLRVQLDIDSPWLSGHFDGAIVAKPGSMPVVRAQFFPDVGGKVLDMLAQPDRLVLYLPPLREGIDAPLPLREAFHPLAMMGLTLLERLAPISEGRILGIRENSEGVWLLLKPVVKDSRVMALLSPEGTICRKRFEWIHGISWEESISEQGASIHAPGMKLRAGVQESEILKSAPDALFDLRLPADVRPLQGIR